MPHTYTCLHYHCVFSTLGRRNLISADLQPRLCAYLGGVVKNIKGFPVKIGGAADHVHALVTLAADVAVAAAVRDVKSNSSRWIHQTFPAMSGFAWQEGYGAFTVSRSNLDAAARYVAAQQEHHRQMTFQQEFIALLKRHGIDYDERYIWD
jgi:putative transposase